MPETVPAPQHGDSTTGGAVPEAKTAIWKEHLAPRTDGMDPSTDKA
jgi:hypothetical protein